MIYGSVCSGIEAATVAWHSLGWKPAFFSEIEKFPSAVLAHHYPDVPNYGDMTKFKEWPDAKLDVLVGGTPCQSFSVAGLRKGLADPRGNLMLTYLAIADRYCPRIVVWENVPGVLSSNGGKDFGALLGGLAELGYGFAYRILDAQYVGVPQRRRRVFVVGYLGNWRRAAAVLFERHSLSGDPAPSRKAGKGFTHNTAPCLTSSGRGVERAGDTRGQDPVIAVANDIIGSLTARGGRNGGQANDDVNGNKLICVATGQAGAEIATDMAPTLNCNHEAPYIAHSLRGEGFDASEDGTGRGTPLVPVQPYTLAIRGRGDSHDLEYRQDGTANALLTPNGGRGGIGVGAVAFDCKASGQNGFGIGEIASTMRSMSHANSHQNGGGHQAVMTGMQVRRLTPKECERLQGFPDFYTLIPGKAADGPRYKALGNSMAVPVMNWIGKRIDAVHRIDETSKQAAA